jgi:hypothetical protein
LFTELDEDDDESAEDEEVEELLQRLWCRLSLVERWWLLYGGGELACGG